MFCVREDNINMDPKETGFEDVDWINLPQVRVHCLTVVNTVMNLRVP